MPSFLHCCPPLDQGFLYGKNGSGQRDRKGRKKRTGQFLYACSLYIQLSIPVSGLVRRMGKRLADTLNTF